MAKRQIHSSLKVLLVSDLNASQEFYRKVLGCEVTEWWVIRDGFTGLGIKLLQANSPEDVQPNKPSKSSTNGYDLYCYVENWTELNHLYEEFKDKGAQIAIEPWEMTRQVHGRNLQ
ncbi:catechol 2,3-dioxygenase-like lactoylglutathione lyase family enzyme [Bacillus mesophilus]|uniref:VOC family protein n=1 Tax=Bacillus mesophilus TaxID=1808955 RepID=UPI001EF87ADB|nr:VOC family protein [Bacillus mesophilus]MBM7660162.1 catechol 2,3-dioxygenase-like lactoylglutathione lyase family enzyme [Bacillus mesophilus]